MRTLYLITALALTGCYSSLNIRIATVDRDLVESSARYLRALNENLTKEVAMKDERYFDKLKADLFKAIDEAAMKELSNADLRNSFLNGIQKKIDEPIEAAKSERNDALNLLTEMAAQKTISKEKLAQAKVKISASDLLVLNIGQVISEDLRKGLNTSPELLEEKLRATAATAVKAPKKSIYGNTIIDDPMATLIASLPNRYWRKHKVKTVVAENTNESKSRKMIAKANINKVKVNTFFGNADIAFKMDEPGVFVIKGVRMDASEAMKASFKMLNMGIKYMAYASGIPVPQPANSGGDAPEIATIPGVTENKRLTAEINRESKKLDASTALILNTIFQNKDKLLLPGERGSVKEPDPDEKIKIEKNRKQAIEDIQRVYNLNFPNSITQ